MEGDRSTIIDTNGKEKKLSIDKTKDHTKKPTHKAFRQSRDQLSKPLRNSGPAGQQHSPVVRHQAAGVQVRGSA